MSERIDESSGWPIVNLVEQLEQIIDNRGKTPIKADSGIPSLSAKSVKMGVIEYEKVYFVSQETYDKFMVRGLPKVGDVLLTTEAPLGCVARLDRNDVCLAQRLITLRGKEGVLDNDYLRLYLSSSLGQHELISRASGSTVQGIKRTEFSKIDIVLPPFKKQLEIAKVIRAIEEKIEVNQQTNRTLENIAQAIFKNWFVDFEPTRAKIIAKEKGANTAIQELAAQAIICGAMTLEQLEAITQNLETTLQQAINEKLSQANQTPINTEQLKTTAALFPNELVDSELGEIPEGWEGKVIGDYVDTVSKTYPLKEVEEVIFLNTGDIKDGRFLHSNKSDASILPGQAKKSIQEGDILYSEIRPQNKRFAYVNFAGNEHVVSTKLMVLRKKEKIESAYIYFILTQQSVIDYLQIIAESRSGTFPQITFDAVSKIEFICPDDLTLIHEFTKRILLPTMKKQWAMEAESQMIANLRDTLLPKLLSGELKVS